MKAIVAVAAVDFIVIVFLSGVSVGIRWSQRQYAAAMDLAYGGYREIGVVDALIAEQAARH